MYTFWLWIIFYFFGNLVSKFALRYLLGFKPQTLISPATPQNHVKSHCRYVNPLTEVALLIYFCNPEWKNCLRLNPLVRPSSKIKAVPVYLLNFQTPQRIGKCRLCHESLCHTKDPSRECKVIYEDLK